MIFVAQLAELAAAFYRDDRGRLEATFLAKVLGPLEGHLTGLGELSQLVAERGALRDIFDRYREKCGRPTGCAILLVGAFPLCLSILLCLIIAWRVVWWAKRGYAIRQRKNASPTRLPAAASRASPAHVHVHPMSCSNLRCG